MKMNFSKVLLVIGIGVVIIASGILVATKIQDEQDKKKDSK